jgi:hypothetical protein
MDYTCHGGNDDCFWLGGAQSHVEIIGRILVQWRVDSGDLRLIQWTILYVIDNADDSNRLVSAKFTHDAFSEWILTEKHLFGHGLIDKGYTRFCGVILLGEIPAAQQSCAQGFKIPDAYTSPDDLVPLARVGSSHHSKMLE